MGTISQVTVKGKDPPYSVMKVEVDVLMVPYETAKMAQFANHWCFYEVYTNDDSLRSSGIR